MPVALGGERLVVVEGVASGVEQVLHIEESHPVTGFSPTLCNRRTALCPQGIEAQGSQQYRNDDTKRHINICRSLLRSCDPASQREPSCGARGEDDTCRRHTRDAAPP